MIVYYSSASENTHRFVQKLEVASLRIGHRSHDETPLVHEPYILLAPTYADGEGRGSVPKKLKNFLTVESNRAKMVGVIGCGNRNFGALFCHGAIQIAMKCNVPLLYRIELAGEDRDVARVKEIYRSLIGDV